MQANVTLSCVAGMNIQHARVVPIHDPVGRPEIITGGTDQVRLSPDGLFDQSTRILFDLMTVSSPSRGPLLPCWTQRQPEKCRLVAKCRDNSFPSTTTRDSI